MSRLDPKGDRWHQRAGREEARSSYLEFDWPEPVSIASKGYAGSGGAWCFVARSMLEMIALFSALPGLKHWSARSVVYVGRSGGSIIAVRLRPTWIQPPGEVKAVWRAPLDAVAVTARTFGLSTLVDFGGHPVWVLTDELDSLLAGRRTA
jgi:hypothetical protein